MALSTSLIRPSHPSSCRTRLPSPLRDLESAMGATDLGDVHQAHFFLEAFLPAFLPAFFAFLAMDVTSFLLVKITRSA